MSNSGVNGKTIAIISYITFIGWIAAYFLNGSTKSYFATFHLRQSLGILISGFAVAFTARFMPILGIFGFGVLILWVIGLITAINGEQKPVPFLGIHFQNWFSGL